MEDPSLPDYPLSAQVSELDRLLLLTDVADSVDGFASLQETISRLCTTVLPVMQCDYACVRLPDENGARLHIVASSDPEKFIGDEILDVTSGSIVGPVPGHRPPSVDAFLVGRTQVVARVDATGDAPWQQHFRNTGIQSMVSLPLVRRSQVLGVLNCYWMNEFDPDDAQMLTLQVVGRLSALAIESARRAESLRRRIAEDAAARSQSDEQRVAALTIATVQSELAHCCTLTPVAALAGIVQILADRMHCAVAIAGADEEVLAVDGPVDEVRLATEGDGSGLHRTYLEDAHGPLGVLTLSRDVDDVPVSAQLLAFARRILVPVLARRVEDLASARIARPYALLSACSGLLDGLHTALATDALSIGSHERLEVALCRFSTPADAFRFASQSVRHAPGWDDAVAGVSIGDDAIILLGDPSRPHDRLDPDRHRGLVGAGISSRFTGIGGLPAFVEQARIAACAGAPDRRVVRFEDLGPAAALCAHLPTAELRGLVERRLGTLIRYDVEHGTDLLRTLRVFVESGGSVDTAATALLIHRNTVHQRLRRIIELSGLDPRSYTDLSEIVMLLQWQRYLTAIA